VASLSQGRTAAAQCGLFTHKSVPVIFEPPCIIFLKTSGWKSQTISKLQDKTFPVEETSLLGCNNVSLLMF